MAVSETLETMHENDQFDMFPGFLFFGGTYPCRVIPTTSCSAEGSFSALLRLKKYLRSTMGQQRVINSVLINTERTYANLLISSAVEMAETAISFHVFRELI